MVHVPENDHVAIAKLFFVMSLRISPSAFNGACILSAVGSLPMHVMPILIASATLTDRLSAVQAGLLATMYAFGQLAITTVLPLMTVRYLSNGRAMQVSLLLALILYISAQFTGILFYLNWFVIGVCCGILSYLGSTSAAAVENKTVAYATRLGVTLLVAGLAMWVFYSIDNYLGFAQLTGSLATVVTVLCIVGLYLYRAPMVTSPNETAVGDTSSCSKRRTARVIMDDSTRWGLACLCLFALAQVGFIVFAVESATRRGIDIGDALWVFALCKIVAAFLLLRSYGKTHSSAATAQSYLICIPVLICGCVLIASTHIVFLFMVGILLWETSVNMMSSAFQASVVETNPEIGGMYLTGVLLFGSAIGPMINGASISAGHQEYFFCLVFFSIFLPFLWDGHGQLRQKLASEKNK